MNSSVWTNQNWEQVTGVQPLKTCRSAEVACRLIGYFQLLPCIPCCIRCSVLDFFFSKHAWTFTCFFPSRQVSDVDSTRGSLLWWVREEGVKIGEADSPLYCSLRPLMTHGFIPESALCLHTQTKTHTSTHTSPHTHVCYERHSFACSLAHSSFLCFSHTYANIHTNT